MRPAASRARRLIVGILLVMWLIPAMPVRTPGQPRLAYLPFNSAVRQLVHADSGRSIDTVIVNGRVVVRQGRLVSVDEHALRAEAQQLMPGMRADFETLRRDFESVRPYFDEVHRRSWATPLTMRRSLGA
jgi:hypothetical protein